MASYLYSFNPSISINENGKYLYHSNHSVHPLAFLQGGVDPPTNFSKRGVLTRPQLLKGVAGKEGVTFFRVGCNFHIKNKLKSEIFNGKKVYRQKYFSPSILPKNLVTFKR